MLGMKNILILFGLCATLTAQTTLEGFQIRSKAKPLPGFVMVSPTGSRIQVEVGTNLELYQDPVDGRWIVRAFGPVLRPEKERLNILDGVFHYTLKYVPYPQTLQVYFNGAVQKPWGYTQTNKTLALDSLGPISTATDAWVEYWTTDPITATASLREKCNAGDLTSALCFSLTGVTVQAKKDIAAKLEDWYKTQ